MGKKKNKGKDVVPERYEEMNVLAEREAFPGKEVKSQRRISPSEAPRSAVAVLAGILRDTKRGKNTANARDDYIFNMARKRVPYSEIARHLSMPIGEVQAIHKERLKQEYDASPEEMRMILVDQISALQEKLWSMTEAGLDKSTGSLILQSVKLLADLHGLAKKEASVTVNLITEHQSTLVVGAVNIALEKVITDPRVIEALPAKDRQLLVATGLRAAAELTQAGQDQMIELT